MKLTAFDAGDGDCLLLTGSGGGTVLFDGGRRGTFRANAAPGLTAVDEIDLVCVTHIDNDHIHGVVVLVDHLIQQARADFHANHPAGQGNPNAAAPDHRPPRLRHLWHNSFPDLLGRQAADVGAALRAQHLIFSAVFDDDGHLLHDRQRLSTALDIPTEEVRRVDNLATGFLQAIELDQKIGGGGLIDSVNDGFAGGLVERPGGNDPTVPSRVVGGMTVHVLAPTSSQLRSFREDWAEWVEKNTEAIEELTADIAERLLTTDSGAPRIVESARRSSLTPQNLVSIVALAEENGVTALFTGDAHEEDILDGLRQAGRLDQNGDNDPEEAAGHLNLVKVQHHGSPNNLDRTFATAVTADHYVFCGNGAHGNPSLPVIDHIIDSRVAAAGSVAKARTQEADQPFHLWFTGHPDRITSQARSAHMATVLDHVETRIAQHPDRLGATVLNGASFDVDPAAPVAVGALTGR